MPETKLETKIEKINNTQYDLIGRLDADSVPGLVSQVTSMSKQQSENIVSNLEAITHSSSAGIAFLLEWLRQANSHQFELQFTNMPVKMKAIAEICGLSEILPIK